MKISSDKTDGRQRVEVRDALKVFPIGRALFYEKLRRGDWPCYRVNRKIIVDIDEIWAAMRQPANGGTDAAK